MALKSAKLDIPVQSSLLASPQAGARNDPTSAPAVASASAPVAGPALTITANEIAALRRGSQMSADAPVEVATPEPPSQVASNGPSVMNQLTPEETADLVKRGRELIATGKIRDARPLLERPAEAGNATAAFALGTTYDPVELEKLGVHNSDSDIAMARAWYQKAKDFGSTAPEGIPLPRRNPHRLDSAPARDDSAPVVEFVRWLKNLLNACGQQLAVQNLSSRASVSVQNLIKHLSQPHSGTLKLLVHNRQSLSFIIIRQVPAMRQLVVDRGNCNPITFVSP